MTQQRIPLPETVTMTLLCALLATCGGDYPSPTAGIDLARARTLVEQSEQAGYITRRTCLGNEAHVRPEFWQALDAQGKKGLVLALAKLCAAEQSGDRMTVYDAQSGKRIANYHGTTVSFD